MATTPWGEHGALRISENGHYVEHEDGKAFFWLGDTAWRLTTIKPEDVTRYMENRKSLGFNVIQFVITGMGKVAYNGEWPFVEGEEPWDAVNFNEKFWIHADFIVAEAKRLGLYVAPFVWWGDKADKMFTDPQKHNFEFGQKLGARYKDEPHVIWVGAGEYHKPNLWKPPVSEEHLSNLVRLVEGIREGDTGNHLLTMHPLSMLSSSEEFHDEDWLDFNMVQSHVLQDYIDHLITGDWEREPAKPTINTEPWYEGEEELFERRSGMMKVPQPRKRRFDTGWIQRYQAYWSVFFGGFGYTYGHMNIWMMNDIYEIYSHARWGTQGVLLESALNAPGARDLKFLRALMEGKPMQAHVPDQKLISLNTRGSDANLSPNLRCATRDEEGKWAYIYSTRGEPMRVVMHRLTNGQAQAFWYNPRNGLWHVDGVEVDNQSAFETGIASGTGASDYYFYPPESPADGNDWVLVLEVA